MAVAAAIATYVRCVRRRVLDFGATATERSASLPGDEIVADAAIQPWRGSLGVKLDRQGGYSSGLLLHLGGCFLQKVIGKNRAEKAK